MTQIWANADYEDFLQKYDFNEEQIEFLCTQRQNYMQMVENAKDDKEAAFDYDTYERDMWYTINRSGLFENDEDNKSGITNWGPNDTRRFITFQ